MKEECWQGARRRVELKLGQKEKKKKKVWQAAVIQACRAPTSSRASKKSMFHSCEKPCHFHLEIPLHHFFAAAQRLVSERHPSFSEPNILLRYFCILWITGAVKIFTWAQNHLEREGKNPSKVPAAFYPVSASKMFWRNWRYEKSSFHYWQWKPLRHFMCFIAFN